jgi:hypothetical protein
MNGICEVEINGVKHTLLFGMRSVMIFQEKSLAAVLKLNEGLEDKSKWKDIDPIKQLNYLFYAGLCNYAESKDLEFPSFESCYTLVDELLAQPNADELSVKIFNTFKDSRAGTKLIELLTPKTEEAKEEVKKKKVKKIG